MTVELNEANAEAITRPIFESIHKAYENSDRKSLIENNFSKKMKDELTEKVFDQAIREHYSKYGELVEMSYLGYVSRDAGHQVMWKCKYDTNTEEVVWQIYFSKENTSSYEVVGLWFGY